jgi:hypothetical protein
MKFLKSSRLVSTFVLGLVLTILAAALPAVVQAQTPNPSNPGNSGGFDKYQNLYPPNGGQFFSTGSWSDLSTCLASPVVTISIASPAVITVPNSCAANQAIVFQSSGALPTGLTAGTVYYVISAGLSTTSFEVSTSVGGGAVNTSGTQSGVQEAFVVYTNSTTSFTAAMLLPPVPPGLTVSGHCTLLWQTSNATSGTLTLGIQPNNTTSTLVVLNTAHTGANGATLADVSSTFTSGTIPAAISGTMLPGVANTSYRDDVYFQLTTSPTGTSTTVLTLYGESNSASYTVFLMPGSACFVGY